MSKFNEYQQDKLFDYRRVNKRSEFNTLTRLKEDDFKKNLN
jgi:hypothetical protein